MALQRVTSPSGEDDGVDPVLRVLGPLEVARDGQPVPIGGPNVRLTLALLLALVFGIADRATDGGAGRGADRGAVTRLAGLMPDDGAQDSDRDPDARIKQDANQKARHAAGGSLDQRSREPYQCMRLLNQSGLECPTGPLRHLPNVIRSRYSAKAGCPSSEAPGVATGL